MERRLTMLRKNCLILIALTLLVLTAACSRTSYRGTLNYWTEKANIYCVETFQPRLLWTATYLSPEYREKARLQIDKWKKLTPSEWTPHASYIDDSDTGSFLISIYTPRGYPPINAESDNFWEFTLDLPTGESYVPSSIESVRITPREIRLFPYVNSWSKFYWVKFPVAYLNPPFALSLRSAGVTSLLEWE